MSIPDFPTLMLPLLKFANDQREHASREAVDYLARLFELSDAEREKLRPSGGQTIFYNRVHWAKTSLKHAGLLEDTRWGVFRITRPGIAVLQQNLPEISIRFLKQQFPQYIQFVSKKDKNGLDEADLETTTNPISEELVLELPEELVLELPEESLQTPEELVLQLPEELVLQLPEELLDDSYQRIRQDLAQELLNRIKGCSPSFFERLVVELLVTMGYGGSQKDAGEAVGKSGDDGIDGSIKADRLGLDTIYIQAKRWNRGMVGSPEIRDFVGALHGQHASKGIFITTSNFSRSACEYVSKIGSKIVLIDGEQLVQLMIDYNVGVSKAFTYEIKKIDSDYFTEV